MARPFRLKRAIEAFQVPEHSGFLGNILSLVKKIFPIDIRAIKKAENGKQLIVRLQELFGKDIDNVEVSFAGKITAASEVDGQERKIDEATLKDGKLLVSLTKFGMRSYAVTLSTPLEKISEPECTPLTLDYNENVISSEKYKKNGAFGGQGYGILLNYSQKL